MDTPDSTTVKRCTTCGYELPLTAFSKSKLGKYGVRSVCRDCERKYRADNADSIRRRKAEYRQSHKDEIRATKHEWEQRNREKLNAKARERYPARREKTREYRLQNRDQLIAYDKSRRQQRAKYERMRYADDPVYREKKKESARKYAAANPEKAQERVRMWNSANPTKYKIMRIGHDHRRRARKLILPNSFTVTDWQFALDYFGGGCAVCGRQPGLWHTLAADHWVALSRGGGTTADNIVPLCHGVGGCNNSKNDRDAADWLIGRYGKRKGQSILKRIESYLKARKQETV